MNSTGKHILLLQGPFGPFFENLARAIDSAGMISHRITFNMGDQCFAKAQRISAFYDRPEAWAEFLKSYLIRNNIACVILYGDSRFYHQIARDNCAAMDIPVLCLEEGYMRPGYITAEWGGNNVNSPLLTGVKYDNHFDYDIEPMQLPNTFSKRRMFGIAYYYMKFFFSHEYPHNKHHRDITEYGEMFKWIWAGVRKYTVMARDQSVHNRISSHQGRLFFCPLQVAVDAQIIHHSSFETMESFISHSISQFAKHCQQDDYLLFKHHPMDRGFKHYARFIRQCAKKHAVEKQVHYCFDIDLAFILANADACITINSTVGFEAIRQNIPTFLFGPAFYQGLAKTQEDMSFQEFTMNIPAATAQDLVGKFEKLLKEKSLIPGDYFAFRDETTKKITELVAKILF